MQQKRCKSVRTNRKWSQNEIAILIKWYPMEGYKVESRLPYWSRESIRKKAFSLGLTSLQEYELGDWTPEEDKILIEKYCEGSCSVQAVLSHRSIKSIQQRARRLGLKAKKSWGAVELEILKEHYPVLGSAAQRYLPGRSISAINNKAKRLGLTKQDTVAE